MLVLLVAGSSVYWSEDSDAASIREIQQEILRADIERHIQDNFSLHNPITVFTMEEDDDEKDDDDDDDDDMDQDERAAEEENVNPDKRSSSNKRKSSGVSGSGKKRRRRTQTPSQRKAANMRERKRMCHLNFAFDALKSRLPNVRNRKKLSRIQTLRAAIFYISLLSDCLQTS
jgi:inositol hexakisphosphate/diphosphoinositol-pentakisphosphate kinase